MNPIEKGRFNSTNKLKVIHIDQGVANRIGSDIEIHQDLINHPRLYSAILNHELDHTDKSFSWHDFKIDLFRKPGLSYFQLAKFMITRPNTWVQLVPIYYHKTRGWVFDLNLLVIYSIYIVSYIGLLVVLL